MVKRTKRRLAQATLLIIAEGPIDKAFLEHLKDLYDSVRLPSDCSTTRP
jgi:hypothetical protein